MGRKVKTRSVGTFVRRTDWSTISDLPTSRKLYWEAVRERRIGRSKAEWMRFWIVREVALAKGDHPERLLLWLLGRPEEPLPQWAEDLAIQVLRGTRVTKEGTDTARIGTILPVT